MTDKVIGSNPTPVKVDPLAKQWQFATKIQLITNLKCAAKETNL